MRLQESRISQLSTLADNFNEITLTLNNIIDNFKLDEAVDPASKVIDNKIFK